MQYLFSLARSVQQNLLPSTLYLRTWVRPTGLWDRPARPALAGRTAGFSTQTLSSRKWPDTDLRGRNGPRSFARRWPRRTREALHCRAFVRWRDPGRIGDTTFVSRVLTRNLLGSFPVDSQFRLPDHATDSPHRAHARKDERREPRPRLLLRDGCATVGDIAR
jgi:hypothetical protein